MYTVRTGPSVRIILLPFVYIVMCSSAILSIVCHFGWLSVLYLCIRIWVRFFVCRCFRNKHLATTTEHNLEKQTYPRRLETRFGLACMIARRSPRTSRKSAKVAVQLQPESEDDSSTPNPPPASSKPKGKKPASTSSKGKRSSSKKTIGGDVSAHGAHDEREDESQDGDDSFEAPNDPSAELGLAALRDSPEGMKPFYPYSTLIRYEAVLHPAHPQLKVLVH